MRRTRSIGLTSKRVLALSLAAILIVSREGAAEISLPDIGDSSGAVLSQVDEQALGEAFMREMRARLDIVDDPEIADYVQSLGYRLASRSEMRDLRFQFFVIASPVINAFAAPGGFIGINAGLIEATTSESELAAVLAHEIAHVTQRHLARAIELAGNMTLPALAGILAAIALGIVGGGQAGTAAAAALTAGQAQMQLNFSRSNEQEADRLGMQILYASGFDPQAMSTFFERLQQSQRYFAKPPEFLSTHPVTGSRIADSRSRAEQFPYRQYVDSVAYQLIQAKLRVVVNGDPQQAVQYFAEAKDEEQPQVGVVTRYGYILALLKAGYAERARAELGELSPAAVEAQIPLQIAAARVELELGKVDEALRIYQEATRLYPNDRALTYGYAEALLRAGQPAEVLALVDRYRRHYPLDAVLYKASAEAHMQLGHQVEAKVALAEHYYLSGQLDAAIEQMRLAQKVPENDFYQRARITARLSEFESEQAQRAEK
ncbi:MAG: M48 family metalloprotease [Gammaproteobacteria bacterium]